MENKAGVGFINAAQKGSLKIVKTSSDGKVVDTPILTPFEIGAAARPFITHHNTLNMDMVLRIETELYLKRLIVGGMERVYEVGRIFRNEGMDPKHNPEFTTIELYQAYTDYYGMMDLVEDMMKTVAMKVCGSLKMCIRDNRKTAHQFVNFALGTHVNALGGFVKNQKFYIGSHPFAPVSYTHL